MMRDYILDGKTPVPVDILVAAEWMATHIKERQVAYTNIAGLVRVSTVFLSFDHNWGGEGRPLLFETAAFWPDEYFIFRCSTWEEAEILHRAVVFDCLRLDSFLAFLKRSWEAYWEEALSEWRSIFSCSL